MAAWDIISQLTAPAAGVFNFTGLTLTAYPVVKAVLEDIVPTSDDTLVSFQFRVGGTLITAYRLTSDTRSSSNSTGTVNSTSSTSVPLSEDAAGFRVGNAADESLSGVIEIGAPTAATIYKFFHWREVHILPSGHAAYSFGGGVMEDAGVINGFNLLGSSNLVSGRVTLLGLRTS